MGLTDKQELPNKPIVKEPWTFKRLFPFGGTASAIAKTFTSPIEVIFGFMVLVTGIAEVIGQRPSWMWYVLTLLVLTVLVGTPYVASLINKPSESDD